jgi:ElaB/YqjD/DUF883 family membrane-anchored ribosome-binding protein
MAQTTDLVQSTDRSAEEIRRDIEARRESITHTVEKLNTEVHRALDWKYYVSEHPIAAVTVAAGAGFLVSRLFRRRDTPMERLLDAAADGVEDIAETVLKRLGLFSGAKSIVKASGGALSAFAVKQVAEYIRSRMETDREMRGEQFHELEENVPSYH